MVRPLCLLVTIGLLGIGALGSMCPAVRSQIELAGLVEPVRVTVDPLGTPHVEARNDRDLFRVLGFLHARDRFFQMDWNRRRAEGRLGAFSGEFVHLQADAGTRMLRLREAARRSLDALEPRERDLLAAYADGVNAWLAGHPLPAEYAALEVSVVAPWTPEDSLLLGKGLVASILAPRLWEVDESAILQEYVDVLGAERAALVYPDELQRFAAWLPFATVPDALGTPLAQLEAARRPRTAPASGGRLASRLAARAVENGFLAQALARPQQGWGSNAWGVAAAHSATGGPLVAGDPHLGGLVPSVVYEAHLLVSDDPDAGPLNASGATAPGVPGIVLGGQSDRIAWAVTAFSPDVSDVFRDRLVRDDPGCPARLCIRSAGALHPVEERSEQYFLNLRGDGVPDNATDATAFIAAIAPQATALLNVPFRSFGPVLEVTDRSVLTGGPATETDVLTLQWTGLHADRAFPYVLDLMRARDVFAFEDAVEQLTAGGLHHVVADVDGNLAYYAGGEIPLRSDLEAGAPLDGLPPWLIRDGSGAANWIPDPGRSQGQVLPFAVLPRAEMPRVVNPPAGFVVNCNEDPSGFALDNDLLDHVRPSQPGAIHYLGDLGGRGLRNARVTRMLREKTSAGVPLTLDDMKRIQADTRAAHADVLVPPLLAAFDAALQPGAPAPLAALAADPRIVEAIGRIRAWDFSHPTGIPEGYDASDVGGMRSPMVSEAEARASVAATLYEVWTIKLVKRFRATIQSYGVRTASPIFTLVWFLSQDPFTGVGASGLDYFPEPAGLADASDRRDVLLLDVLRETLDALPGPAYALAFANSTAQDDYRWGKLHRIVLPHAVDPGSSIPPAAGFAALGAQLPGLARDGTWESVNVAPGPGLPDGSNEWVNAGTAPLAQFRHVHALLGPSDEGDGVSGFAALNGGASGDPGSPFYASQLGAWLTADYHPVAMSRGEVRGVAHRIEQFVPAP